MSPLDAIVPPIEVPGIAIAQRGAPMRRITQADLAGDLRISLGGPHRAELVAAYRHYDGATGGQAGYYANIFNTWRVGTQTWRSQGVRVLVSEAERVARALDRGTGTRPGAEEEPRIGGTGATTQLRAYAVDEAVLLYVRHGAQGGKHARSRGVLIGAAERPVVAEGLRAFAKMRGRAK